MGLRPRKESRWDIENKDIQNHIHNDRGTVWVSSNGNNISIANMDINHLKNAIAKVERGELESRLHILVILKLELIYRQIYTINNKNETNEQ